MLQLFITRSIAAEVFMLVQFEKNLKTTAGGDSVDGVRIIPIVPHRDNPDNPDRVSVVSSLIRQHRLTDAIEVIESAGWCDRSSQLFILGAAASGGAQ